MILGGMMSVVWPATPTTVIPHTVDRLSTGCMTSEVPAAHRIVNAELGRNVHGIYDEWADEQRPTIVSIAAYLPPGDIIFTGMRWVGSCENTLGILNVYIVDWCKTTCPKTVPMAILIQTNTEGKVIDVQ